MANSIKNLIEELDCKADNPHLYDEIVLRSVLNEVSEVLDNLSDESSTLLISYISAVESVIGQLSTILDKTSFGLGYLDAISTIADIRLQEANNRTKIERQFRSFKRHEKLLKIISAQPHFSHQELAEATNYKKGRLSQIMAELKENHLVLIDKLGKENRYELTTAAKKLLFEEADQSSNILINLKPFEQELNLKETTRGNISSISIPLLNNSTSRTRNSNLAASFNFQTLDNH